MPLRSLLFQAILISHQVGTNAAFSSASRIPSSSARRIISSPLFSTMTTTTTSSACCSTSSTKADDEALLQAKKVVLDFHKALDDCDADQVESILDRYTVSNDNFTFRSVYPFRDFLTSKPEVAETFWKPLKTSFSNLRRRTDLFFGGKNMLHGEGDGHDEDDTLWIVSMGHFVGLLDQDWLGIRATRQVTNLRFAEFTQVNRGTNKIRQQALFMDVIGLMQSVGYHPLPPSTGAYYMYPGPSNGNGMSLSKVNAPLSEGKATQALVDRMVDDLSAINHLMTPCPPDVLRKTWHEDMIWYGPAGIGATMTIPRYQEQHQYPFRQQVANKKFAGHVARIAEGDFAAFFGWPHNLTNTPIGGFLGLPGCANSDTPCPMQVVDVYRRDGDKLAENWVFIDIPWYLKAQGLDILARTTGILNPVSLSLKRPVDAITSKETNLPVSKKLAVERISEIYAED